MSVLEYEDDLVGRGRGPSLVIWAIVASAVLFILWAALAWVDEIVRANGEVVSSSRPQIIQNLEGGILAELNVAEGDVVEAGQPLARLQGTQYQAVMDEVSDQIAALEIRRLRLEAELAPEDRAKGGGGGSRPAAEPGAGGRLYGLSDRREGAAGARRRHGVWPDGI